jgi:hypothetical protein
MKSLSEALHKTPWWALLFGGAATLAALAVFVTPYHIIQYRDDGKTAEESRAIKREIDNTFADNAINLGRGVIRGMIARTQDPERRAELEQALAGLEEARQELREAGSEVLRAKREALEGAREATRGLREAVSNAQRETERALKESGPEGEVALKAMERELKKAERAEREAERAVRRAEKGASIAIGPGRGGPAIQIELDNPAPPAPPAGLPPLPGAGPGEAILPPPLPPEVASRIRRDVTGDMYRIGIGAAMILVLVPLFIVAVVVKFFGDRSRASQRVADAKRREAEYHRMGQQVTEAKLAALQAQVEPHFLYNTLASVQALTEVDPAKASEMTGHLIQYLRNALPKMRESVSTVGQEIELARAYLNILQMRMGKRLAFEIDVAQELMEMPFPPLMLPSLVENAIKHGLEPQREGGTVRIAAALAGGRISLSVSDTGRGFSETPGAGVGLANIRERLAALYGDTAKLTLVANEPQGVVASIDVPAEGTRSAAGRSAAAAQAATLEVPSPPSPMPPAAEPPKTGFWPQTWQALATAERYWRKALYYLFIGLVMATAVAGIAGVVAVAVGALPVQLGDDVLSGPFGVLVALAGAIIAFFAVSAALALVVLVIYGLGFFLLAVFIFVAFVVAISLAFAFAPMILIGLAIWWIARRSRAPAPVPATAAPRVEPTMADTGR